MTIAIITVLIMLSAIGIGIYIDNVTSKIRELNNKISHIDDDIGAIYVDLKGIEIQNRSIVNNTSYMEGAIQQIHEYVVTKPKIEEVPLTKTVKCDALFVVEDGEYMQLYTKDGYCLPCNISLNVNSSVDEPLTATATFHVKKGRILE